MEWLRYYVVVNRVYELKFNKVIKLVYLLK